jgi:cytochrome d ubiquinol oxidase subunit I
MDYALQIPKLSSLILRHDANAAVAGLDTVAPADRPPVGWVFWAFRVMVGLGFLMLALGLWSLYARWRGKLYEWQGLHRFAVVMGPSGLVAVLAGWVTTEVGRQPWTIHGLLRTAESASPLAAPAVAASLAAFVVVYFAVFGVGVRYILKLMAQAPQEHETQPPHIPMRSAGTTPALGLQAEGAALGAPLEPPSSSSSPSSPSQTSPPSQTSSPSSPSSPAPLAP